MDFFPVALQSAEKTAKNSLRRAALSLFRAWLYHAGWRETSLYRSRRASSARAEMARGWNWNGFATELIVFLRWSV